MRSMTRIPAVCMPYRKLIFMTLSLISLSYIWLVGVTNISAKPYRNSPERSAPSFGVIVRQKHDADGDDDNDDVIPMAYTAPSRLGLKDPHGRRINVDPGLLRRLRIPFTNFVKMNKATFNEFIIATAASENHAKEIEDAIASMQANFPKKKIIFYDLGLKEATLQRFRTYCGLTIRSFNFSAYPSHVQDLQVYAWKIMIIQGLLREFYGVMWMDASARIKSGKFDAVYQKAFATGGIVQFKDTDYSNFALTHNRTYEYFPTLVEQQKNVRQSTANMLLFFRTRFAYWKVLHWWFLCALDPECISPIKNKIRDFTVFPGEHFANYLNCHRFDQSLITLLNSNQYGLDTSQHYTLDPYVYREIMVIKRQVTHMYEIQICP